MPQAAITTNEMVTRTSSASACRIRKRGRRAWGGPLHAVPLAAENRMNHDGRKKSEGGKSYGGEKWKRPFDADFRQFVRRQRAEVPGESQDRRQEQQWIDA